MPTKKIKLLLIGPYPPDPKGGAAVLFVQLVHELKPYPELDVTVINTFRATRNIVINMIWASKGFLQLIWLIPRANIVSFHASTGATVSLGSIIWVLCRICRKKIIFREFGGRFDWQYENLPAPIRWLVTHTVLSMDILLFETKMLTRYFEKITSKPVVWYANSRPLPENRFFEDRAIAPRKFVYIGHVRPCKGVRLIKNIAEEIPSDVKIDVYGPLQEGVEANEFKNINNLKYCGVLEADQVMPTLKRYDVLLMPTYCFTEGYPGIILEAYMCGIPVITTYLNAIPEIVDDSSGILIEPQNTHQLKNAILKLANDAELYANLQMGAKIKAEKFLSKRWTEKFVHLILELV